MSERTATEFLNLRLPLYAYTAPLWQGRRVLEIGCGDGGSAEYLGSHGADRVLSVDTDSGRVERARARHTRPRVEFRAMSDLRQLGLLSDRPEVVLVPEGQLLLATPALINDLRRLLGDTGHLIVAVPAADRKGRMAKDGVGYYDLADALAERFPVLRMLGQTPFLGFGLVEFDGNADALRVDVSLLHGGAEQPSHYVAVAGASAPPSLGYSLVQVPFAPVEAVVFGNVAGAEAAAASSPGGSPAGAIAAPARDSAPAVADARLDMAERRLEESERRARARLEDAENRLTELRRKLEDALVQAESSVRVSRAQAEEIQELRGRIRRGSEDRAAADEELSKLRRALAQADESVLTLTRRTAEEMAVVAEKMVTGLGRGGATVRTADAVAEPAGANAAVDQAHRAELEERTRRAETAAARDRAEIATLTERIRAADEQLRLLKQKSAGVAERDDRIARLEGDKQDLVWRVAELEEKLRHAGADLASRGHREQGGDKAAQASGGADAASWTQQLASARQARDRAIEEFHRGAAAHANEVHQLQSSVAEQAALVAELEDAVRAAEARAVAADKEATTLRRNAKELEEADRARRGRLAELEGKLLRLERERSLAAAATAAAGGGGSAGDDGVLADLRQRLATAEQRAVIAEQRATGAEERAAALAKATTASQSVPVSSLPAASRNGHLSGAAMPAAEVEAAVAGIEERLREEMRALAGIEELLGRAREDATRAFRAGEAGGGEVNSGGGRLKMNVRDDLERALAAKDSQLVEGRLELARLRRDSEARQAQLEREISDLRARLNPSGEPGMSDDHSQSAQLILMHSTLGNIRRRSARLRDELEGFRRRLDTLPPGALSSMLEEIGEDLAEFAK